MKKPISSEYQATLRWINDFRKTTKTNKSMSDYLKEERIKHLDVVVSALNVAMGIVREKELEERRLNKLKEEMEATNESENN